jgi:ABC-type sulfate/molybdate transport systems ATPase subunit
MSDTALAVRDLRVSRRDHAREFVLEVAALELRRGEVVAVLGPNGAGKSTLLRAMAGLEPPVRGGVERGAAGPVTMVFQRSIVFDGSVEHNVRAALRGAALPRAAVRERIGEALARFGIESMASRRAATLSGGETRRLALARAFALRPAVLLLDEPFEDLDSEAQERLSLDLRRAIAETGVAVAVVTHDLRRALLLADRVAVLRDGRLAQCDARDAVLRRPAGPDVARLVGMTNLIPAEVAPGGDGVRIPGARVALPLADAAFGPGSAVWIGVRPEHVVLEDPRVGALSLGTAQVRTVLSDGITDNLTLAWSGTALRTHVLAGRAGASAPLPGARVEVWVHPEDVHLMPRDASA